MFLNEMYNIEKIIQSYKMSGITDIKQLINLRDCNKLSHAGSIYYYRAVIIPYREMLKYIDEYKNMSMEETTEMLWWDRLTEKYNTYNGQPILFSVNDTISRFKDVERLSKYPIFEKRLEELYGMNKDRRTKNNSETAKVMIGSGEDAIFVKKLTRKIKNR